MKIVDKPVNVITRQLKIPQAFEYRGKQQVEKIVDFWVETGEWWEGDPERAVYRVSTKGGGMFELYRNKGANHWFLYKIYD
jgi:hypothetical protein